ncbi:MAG TPA: pyrroloquinoline quinone biosynthesis protein PqqB [Labilithrix sp.]
MRAIVLGSAAGGGFPQWNCACANCSAVRANEPGFVARTQDSIAFGDTRFLLVNASPDVHAQIRTAPALWPRGPRHTPIGAVVLTNGDLDHVLGLFSLRESQPLAVYATPAVWRGIEESAFVRTLRRFEGQLVKRELALGETVAVSDARGEPLGIAMKTIALPGKAPVHSRAAASEEDNIGLVLSESGGPTLAYAAACGSLDGVDLAGHAALLFDGTFFTEDELVRQGLGEKRAKDMAHVPIRDSLAKLRFAGRRIYTHVNNTNPILAPSSEERRAVLAAGWEIAHDGMEIEL